MKVFQDELYCQYIYETSGSPDPKDILIIVHDQLEYIKKCIESIYKNTNNFTLYLWDNGSMNPTKEYLKEMSSSHDNIVLVQNSENIGFICPNNNLAAMGKSPYIILLNSDTEVIKGWDTALIGWLKENPKCKLVGYQGSTLDEDGRGNGNDWSGNWIDYVCGWCLCISRETYNTHGLFDDVNLSFAYGEDSDLSLRIKEAGFDIYALHIKLAKHYGNITALEVHKEQDTTTSFESNHEYIRSRHKKYLEHNRMLKIALPSG